MHKSIVKTKTDYDIKIYEKSLMIGACKIWSGDTLRVQAENLREIMNDAFEEGRANKATEIKEALNL